MKASQEKIAAKNFTKKPLLFDPAAARNHPPNVKTCARKVKKYLNNENMYDCTEHMCLCSEKCTCILKRRARADCSQGGEEQTASLRGDPAPERDHPPGLARRTVLPTPETLNPTTPYTQPWNQNEIILLVYPLPPTPYTLRPTPYTLNPKPYNPHFTPHSPHPTPHTLHPTPGLAGGAGRTISTRAGSRV